MFFVINVKHCQLYTLSDVRNYYVYIKMNTFYTISYFPVRSSNTNHGFNTTIVLIETCLQTLAMRLTIRTMGVSLRTIR
jgi:hypothetical protein